MTPRQRYNRLWRKVDRFYGQEGTKPPKLIPVKRGGGFAYVMERPDGQNQRRVYGNPVYRKQLVSPKRSVRRDARFTTLHEWGHLFGPKGSGPTDSEGRANLAANLISRRLNRRASRNKRSLRRR